MFIGQIDAVSTVKKNRSEKNITIITSRADYIIEKVFDSFKWGCSYPVLGIETRDYDVSFVYSSI